MAGADEPAYRTLLTNIFEALKPTDSIEAFWARDIVDLTWEVGRLRQIEAGLLEAPDPAAERQADMSRRQAERTSALIEAMFAASGRDPNNPFPKSDAFTQAFTKDLLAGTGRQGSIPSADHGTSSVPASNNLVQAFLRYGHEFDRISRMITVAEGRRRAVLQELKRYRGARRTRVGSLDIGDTVVTAPHRSADRALARAREGFE